VSLPVMIWLNVALLEVGFVVLYFPSVCFSTYSDKLKETSVLCGFCFPQITSDSLWTSIPVFYQLILSFFGYSPENFSSQIFSSSFLIVDMCKSEL